MPALFYTNGPIHLFVKFRLRTGVAPSGQLSGPAYLGTCVTAPEPDHEKFKIPVMNDKGGRSVPFQLVQDGETAVITATLNRFDYPTYQLVRSLEGGSDIIPTTLPTVVNNIPIPGGELPGARGTLVMGISDFQLFLFNEYGGTASAGPGVGDLLPIGRLYYAANLRKFKESTVGTRVEEIAMAIECQNLVGGSNNLGFGLYKEFTSYNTVLNEFGDVRSLLN